MVHVNKIFIVVLVCLSVSVCQDCMHAQVTSEEHCLDKSHQDGNLEEFVESKQENENAFLNNDHVVQGSSKTPVVGDVIESIGNDELYEDLDKGIQYERESYVTESPHPEREGEGVYDEPPSEMGEVLKPDHKEEGETLTDQLANKNDAEINPSENKTDGADGFLGSQYPPAGDTGNTNKTPEMLSSDVQVDDFMKSRLTFSVEDSRESVTQDKLIMEDSSIEDKTLTKEIKSEILINPPERLTMEETIGDFLKKDTQENKDDTIFKKSFNDIFHMPLNKQMHVIRQEPVALKLTVPENQNDFNRKETPTDVKSLEKEFEIEKNPSVENEDKLVRSTTDTTSAELATGHDISESYTAASLAKTLLDDKMEDFVTKNYTFKTQNNDSLEPLPVAERYYSFNYGNDYSEQNSENRLETETKTERSFSHPYQDNQDNSYEDKVVIKGLLNEYSSFSKEKMEPVLFEECSDCDLRVLPIRPSEHRSTPDEEEESLPSANVKFSELPEGRELQINSLGLSDGIFLFSYLGEFLSLIQPNEFPVELLKDALRHQITWLSLIVQSVQVEAGFVVVLVAGVLLAFAVPVVVLSHACYRMGGRDDQSETAVGWAGNCRRRTLVFILQLLLILLFAGMVAMFVTNEQLSTAVVQSSEVVQTSLGDISSFVHNAHLQLHFLVTQSIDQVLQAIYADLDNVDSLLGRPIQRDLVRETGIDVALDTLTELTRETKETTQQVERFLEETRIAQEMVLSSRDKLSDLRQQVELFRRACGPRDRLMCDTIDATGLDVVLRLDRIKADERLNRMRRMGGIGLEVAAVEAKEHFMSVPSRVDSDTRDAREAVRRQLSRQRAEVDDKSNGLEELARDISSRVNEAKYDASFWMQDIDQLEYWRWIVCLGGGAAVLMIWTMLLCSMCCGCCGSERAAGPTILVTIVLMCLFTTALWIMALLGLLVGGHGEVFLCRPLYDEPDFNSISRMVDQPGVFYSEPRGGFIANVVYGNDSLDVPITRVLQECRDNHAIYPTLGLHRVFDAEGVVDQHRWGSVSSHVRAIRANLSNLEVLSPALQDHLQDLLSTLSVNFTEHRIQMSRPVTGKDMDSFARQLENIGNQLRDLASASRMETLSSRTRRIIDSHIRPLEGKKDSLVYQLTALEVQTGPLQRQVNQSLSHLKTIQFFINSQGEAIAQRKSREYVDRLLNYVEQLRHHVVDSAMNTVARCRPLWDIFNNARLFLCRHTMDPLNGYWFATMWCLLILLVATPVCLKLVDYYRAQGSRPSGSPTENLVISEQGAGWSSPGYDIKYSKEYSGSN